MLKNRHGRVLLASSEHGLYGAPGAGGAAYGAATNGLVGFMRALFREGQKHNVRVNALALGDDDREDGASSAVRDRVAAAMAVCLVGSGEGGDGGLPAEETGRVYCVSADGAASRARWQRSLGAAFETGSQGFSAEMVADRWGQIVEFDEGADYPDSAADGMARMMRSMGQVGTYAAKQAPKGTSAKI